MALDINTAKDFLSNEEFKAFDSEKTDVKQRVQLQNKINNNYDASADPKILEIFGATDNLPAHMREDGNRRARWDWCFQSEGFAGNRNVNIRRSTEIALDNVLKNLIESHPYLRMNKSVYGQMTPQQFQEAMTSSAVDPFLTQVLPLARQIVPQLMFRSLFKQFSVKQPDTKIFSLQRNYGETVAGGATAGSEVWPYNSANRDAFYSGGRVYGEPIGTGDGATVNFDLARAGTATHEVYIDGVLTTAFTVGVGAGAGGVDRIQFTVAPALTEVLTCTYDNQVEGVRGRDIDLTLRETQVDGEVIKLRGAWTEILSQNASAYHNLSISAEYNVALAEEILQDLESHALNQVLAEAGAGNVNFDNAGFLAGDITSSSRRAYQKGVWDSIVEASQLIYEYHRQWPTWIVAGTDLATKLMQLEEFGVAADGQAMMGTEQRRQLGTIGRRWELHQNPNMPANQAILGFKSAQPFQMGYVMTTFLPFFSTGDMNATDASFNVAKGVMYRGGRKMIDSTHYSSLTVTNL